MQLAIEFRHEDWFTSDAGFSLLRKYQRPAVITDTGGRRDAMHMEITTSTAFIRFGGTQDLSLDGPRLQDWSVRISKWISSGVETVYFFIHQGDTIQVAETIWLFQKLLNKNLRIANR
jgi:uncharacterized protein YecE (DUF72 family)